MKRLEMLIAVTLASSAFAMPNLLAGGGQPAVKAQPAMGQMMNRAQMHVGHQMGGLETMRGQELDRAFLSMMIPHHQAAVDMSREILKTTRDARVRVWAEAIIAAQKAEISRMTTMLKPYGGADPRKASEMNKMMTGMVGEVRQAHDKDTAFVKGMVPHHSSGIMMANIALLKSSNPKVLALARDIVRTQAREIYDFQMYLLDHTTRD